MTGGASNVGISTFIGEDARLAAAATCPSSARSSRLRNGSNANCSENGSNGSDPACRRAKRTCVIQRNRNNLNDLDLKMTNARVIQQNRNNLNDADLHMTNARSGFQT